MVLRCARRRAIPLRSRKKPEFFGTHSPPVGRHRPAVGQIDALPIAIFSRAAKEGMLGRYTKGNDQVS
jgi:hypothetical protein